MASKPGRKMINWDKDDFSRFLKMVAFVVYHYDGEHSVSRHFRRFCWILPQLSQRVLGRVVTYDDVVEHFRTTQTREVSENAIFQRGDKTQRYQEFNSMQHLVVGAYHDLKGLSLEDGPEIDTVRDFTNDQLAWAVKRYGNGCYWCKAPFSDMVGKVADHYVPHSKGGRTTKENCRPSCPTCNASKSDMMPDEFVAKRMALAARCRK
jgi:hypothetical protein